MAKMLRLADFIALAAEGREVRAQVTLRKELIDHVLPDEDLRECRFGTCMYLADFALSAGRKKGSVTKVYNYACVSEKPESIQRDRDLANGRLKDDYARLREGGVLVAEEFFS